MEKLYFYPPFKVRCINDKDQPNVIPIDKQVKKGIEYTVIKVTRCNIQGGTISLTLEEIDLTGCEPYTGFDHRRFATVIEMPTPVSETHEEISV